MKNSPKVSIIMPVRNGMPYLPECIHSVLAQSYTNWELFVVDDHSTDHTATFLRYVSRKYDQINFFQNQQRGIIPALRLAYDKSNGDYITRMDADDMMVSDKIEVMVSQLEEKGRGYLALGMVSYISETELGDGYRRYAQWLNRLTKKGENYHEIYKECVIPSPCWMIHRGDLDICGAFDSDIYPEDYDLCFRFYQNKIKCIPSDQVLHIWRDHDDRASRNDPNYADQSFLQLKIHYFLQIDHEPEKKLVVWGAGKKGKAVAQLLQSHKVDFEWITNNPKKIDKNIYGLRLKDDRQLVDVGNCQVLVAIASPDELKKIKTRFAESQKQKEFYFLA